MHQHAFESTNDFLQRYINGMGNSLLLVHVRILGLLLVLPTPAHKTFVFRR